MMKILVHLCCGPCAIAPVQALLEAGHQVTGFFYNPNIHPLQEYLRRRDGMFAVAERLGIPVICKDDEYDPQTYFRAVSFRESNRCLLCYVMRFERTLAIAKRGGFDAFSTTLLYSKFQKHDEMRRLGADMAVGTGVVFHYQDFREGWSHGVTTSKDWGIYRQQYCGCLYSEFERYRCELGKPRD